MSFSKAKIHRFNDVKTPTIKSTSDKTKITPKQINIHSCEKTEAKTETESCKSVPSYFRTPILLKKKFKSVTSNQNKLKSKELFVVDEQLEALKEKIVECENKDAYIKDLSQLIEEYKDKVNKIQQEKKIVGSKVEAYQKTIDNLKIEHEEKLHNIQESFKLRLVELQVLKEQLSNDVTILKQEYSQYTTYCLNNFGNLKRKLEEIAHSNTTYQSKLEGKKVELKDKEKIIKTLEQNMTKMQEQHTSVLENLHKEHKIEVQDLEFEMLKVMTEQQKEKEVFSIKIEEIKEEMNLKLMEMRKKFENEKEIILLEFENEKLKIAENLQSNLIPQNVMEEKIRSIENEWENKLKMQQEQSDDILKECQAISEYSIIQCEIEKNNTTAELRKVTTELNKAKSDYSTLQINFDELKKTYNQLQNKYDSSKKEFDSTKKKLIGEIKKISNSLSVITKERDTYELTIKNSQATIEVLKRRLIHSDKDVEQLKDELSEAEKKMLEYEQKNAQLLSDLTLAQQSNEELDMQYESSVRLNCTEIEKLRERLTYQVNGYGELVTKWKKKNEWEENIQKEIMQQLHEAHEMIARLKAELNNAEKENYENRFEMDQSETELEEYRIREIDWNIIKDKLEFNIQELEGKLEGKATEIENLHEQMEQLQNKLEAQCQSLEYYKSKVKELEMDQQDTDKIHKKYIELSGKYDVLSCKFEELEEENLQNKMKVLNFLDDQKEKELLKSKCERQAVLCAELEKVNRELEKENQERANEEFILKLECSKIKSERDMLLNKIQQLEGQNQQENLNPKVRQHTPKKCHPKTEDGETKKWMKKHKHAIEDKENMGSPNRTLNSSKVDSPLRDRN